MTFRVGVVTFPGSLDDTDAARAIEIAGGTMYELGCHLIDPLVRLLGKHAKVTPVLRHDAKDADALADNCVAVFDFKHAIGIISSATMQPTSGAHRTFEIQGTNGVAIVRPIEQRWDPDDRTQLVDGIIEMRTAALARRRVSSADGARLEWGGWPDNGYSR